MKSVAHVLGKTYKDVQKIYNGPIRVASVGNEPFVGTRDMKPNRLNIKLDMTDVKIKRLHVGIDKQGQPIFRDDINIETLDNAIVIDAYYG